MAISPRRKFGARYRQISIEMYADDRFKALSPPQPSGQSLWIYLLTGPFSTLIPGICVGGEAGIAERLGWSVRAFRRCFAEIATRGMARADWSGPLVFLPNALRHNPPQSPSVITGWRQAWAEVPACELKRAAAAHIRGVLAEHGEPWATAFDRVIVRWPDRQIGTSQGGPQAVDQAGPQVGPHQEQDQDQEQDLPPTSLGTTSQRHASRVPFRAGRHLLDEPMILTPASLEAFEQFMAVYPRPEARKRALDAWRELNPSAELAAHIAADVQKRVADRLGNRAAVRPVPGEVPRGAPVAGAATLAATVGGRPNGRRAPVHAPVPGLRRRAGGTLPKRSEGVSGLCYVRPAEEGERVMAMNHNAQLPTPTLFDTAPRFDAETFDPLFDQDWLSKQLGRVFELMRDGEWRTLDEVQAFAGGREAAVSARLRDLRKTKFGSYHVERRRRGQDSEGNFEYRLLVAEKIA